MAPTHQPKSPPVILTIAGFDPSSGAGITADLKTIAAHGCFGVACITVLTVQNTLGVTRVEPVAVNLVRETLESLTADVTIAGIRVGMLGSAGVADAVADFLAAHQKVPVVLDPILKSSSGAELLDTAGVEVLKRRLLRLATVVTPNLAEAAELTGMQINSMAGVKSAAVELQKMGARNVIVTGGHSDGKKDLVRLEFGVEGEISGRWIQSKATHGTGCAFATALTCNLVKGMDLIAAGTAAKEYVAMAIERAYPIGKGTGPMNHLLKIT